MSFFARVVAAPPELGGGVAPIDASTVDASQLPSLAPNASAALVFVETSATPVLPDALLPAGSSADAALSERLYWRLVSTDSCEALHMGALLTLRALIGLRGLTVCDEHGSPLVGFGMVNAQRVAPFTRHVMVPRAGCTVERPSSPSAASARPRLTFAEAPRAAAYGGALHQLVFCRTAAGRELVMDFTGAQYGIDDRLPSTGTPFWLAEVPPSAARSAGDGAGAPVRLRGFELVGEVMPYSLPSPPQGLLENNMHAYIGSWIRDSALGILDHRARQSGTA